MNKTQLVEAIAKKTDISKTLSAKVVEAFTTVVTDTLSKGEAITLIGFGTFDVNKRNQRTGRNPQTGASIVIPAAKVARFRPGKQLKRAVNNKKK